MAPLSTPSTGVVVTGGGSGIGRAVCLALAEVGRPIAAWDVNGAGAKETAAECADRFGVVTHAAEVDVRTLAAIDAAVADAAMAIGPIGGLCHAAGVAGPMPVPFLDEDQWDAVLDVNLRAHALLVRALLPHLRDAGPGSAIVGISSVEAIVGNGMLPAYCASKAGLLGLTRSMCHALGADGIRVNAVCPGAVETPMLAPALAMPGMREQVEASIPLGRVAQPMDIAKAVRFLLSDEAAYISGAHLVVDAGMTVIH